MMIWLSITGFLFIAFFFSGMEAGLLRLNRIRLRHRAKQRDRAAFRLQKLLRKPHRVLFILAIITNLATVCALALGMKTLGFTAALALFLPVILAGREFFLALFRRFPTRTLAFLSAPLRFFCFTLAPFFWLGIDRLCLRPRESTEAARDDFKHAMLESERNGSVTPAQQRLIHGVVDFRAVTARDLMRPLVDFPVIKPGADMTAGRKEYFLTVTATGEITGYTTLFDLALANTASAAKIRPLLKVQAAEPALQLLRQMRATGAAAALVMEKEVPQGIVLAEAVTRRLVENG